jgi:hypothetical protein
MFSVNQLEDTLIRFDVYNFDRYSRDEYLGTGELALDFLVHYGSRDTDKIQIPLKPSGSLVVQLGLKRI